MVVEHRLRSEDPLEIPAYDWEEEAIAALLDPGAVSLKRAAELVTA
jgi:predicted HTH domain antitoxin